VEAEGGLEELDPRVSAPLRSTRRFGSNWEAARVVEAEGGLEELDPRDSAPLRSTRQFGSNGKQPGWWRLSDVLRSSIRGFQLHRAADADLVLMGSSPCGGG
jgi:hypothetical protein